MKPGFKFSVLDFPFAACIKACIELLHDVESVNSADGQNDNDNHNRNYDRRSRHINRLRRSQISAARDCRHVQLVFPPPATLATGSTTGIAAVVANGPDNSTVDFTCVPAGECGTFTPNPVASNTPTTYQAPPTVPTGNNVTITATSVTDTTKSVSAMVTID